jgi:RimJ/RimL family protein N-acetyltransferase
MPLTVAVPELTTERLVLRGHRLEDFDDSCAMWGDAEVCRFIGGQPSTAEEVWSRLLRYAGHWAMLGFGYWVIEDRASGRFAGEAGFFDLNRAVDPPFNGAPEIGWALAPWAQGRGMASEAIAAVTAWGDAQFGSARTVCMIAPANTPSVRVADKAGYREYARATYKGSPTVLYERKP